MAYEPTQWRSGDTITSERLNKMEQGIAGGGDVYVLHTTETVTPAETEGGNDTYTYSSVELREDGLPMWLITDNTIGTDDTTYASIGILTSYNNEFFYYSTTLYVNRSTGEVGDLSGDVPSGGGSK